jgi:hypothetical protein
MMGFQETPARLFYDFCLDEHVPFDHMLKGIDHHLDLNDLRQSLKPFYSQMGRPSVDPELIIRMLGAALALPYADTDVMQLHLNEISRNATDGAHAVLLFDRAGWHTTSKLDVPDNITPIFLPSRAPELNGRERLAISPPELALKHCLRQL